jgi:DNA-binding MarR family transcriptional regulator
MAGSDASPEATREPRTLPAISQLGELLSRADQYVAQRLSATLGVEGLTLEQWRAIDLLAGGGQTMSAIADRVRLAPATLTRLIDRLVENNVIYRQIDAIDRRRVLVFLSERGRALHDRVAVRIQREQQALAADLGEERAELLADVLQQLADLG